MRLPFSEHEIRFFATPTGDLTEPKGGSAGTDGESWYTGTFQPSSDINPIFRSRMRYIAFNEMRQVDPFIKGLLWLYKLPIRNATWEVTPCGQGKDPVDRAVARAVEWQFGLNDEYGRLAQSWDEWLTQRLLCLDWGSVFEEIIWAKDLDFWRENPDGAEQRPIRAMARMGLRRPSTISKIDWDDETGRIKRVWQDLPGVSEAGIPGEKIGHYAIERDGDADFMGVSLLRSMYQPFRLKKGLMTASAIAWDRWASKLPVVRYPKNSGPANEKRAERIGQNVRTHERAYVVLEGDASEGWDLKLEGGDPSDPTSMLRLYDSQMAAGALTQFSQLGTTERGSRAVGETLAEPFYLSISAVAKQVGLDSMRDVTSEFVKVNFGANVEVPRFKVRKISQRSAESVVNALSLMAGAGFNVVHPEIANTILEMLDLDQIPEELLAEPKEGDDVFPEAVENGNPQQRRTAGRAAATVRASLRGGGVPGALGGRRDFRG